MRGLLRTVLFVVIVFGMLSTSAMAASVTLSWTAPTTNEDGTPLTDLGGYRLYYGTVSGAYSTVLDVGNVLTYQWILGDQEGKTLYFNATAYDLSGNQSIYNGEVTLTFPMIAPSPPVLTGVVD